MIQVSNSKDKPDRFSGVRTSDLIIMFKDNSSEGEEEHRVLCVGCSTSVSICHRGYLSMQLPN